LRALKLQAVFVPGLLVAHGPSLRHRRSVSNQELVPLHDGL
jgi:hypothetical protein